MENFILTNQNELLSTLITIAVILLLKFIGNKAVKRIGRIGNIVEARIQLITKYVSIVLTFFGIGALAFIWGVNFRELSLLFSSIFAIIGVALFASWSILSNVTSGVILFFFFPFKIGDRVKVMDKEIMDGADKGYGVFVIENIKSFHVLLRSSEGELLTYPNNMMLQKGVTLINTHQELKKKTEVL